MVAETMDKILTIMPIFGGIYRGEQKYQYVLFLDYVFSFFTQDTFQKRNKFINKIHLTIFRGSCFYFSFKYK